MTNEMTARQIAVAEDFIKEAVRLIKVGSNEQVVRDNFTSFLRVLFPDTPPWILEHIRGGESALKTHRSGNVGTGFVDNLIGLTPIEYEGNLLNPAKFSEGYEQVRKYCASLVNDKINPTKVIGVLSDTVRWHAYQIAVKAAGSSPVEGQNIELTEIASIDVSAATETDAQRLIDFLKRYLQRLGSRPLDASSIALDLGFESPFCARHFDALGTVVRDAFTSKPDYGALIKDLWCSLVTYVMAKGEPNEFDEGDYVRELYILSLGKLICANIIEAKALISSPSEISEILTGEFFKRRGLENFVEYDYFGWLNAPGGFQARLTPIARDIQRDLRAYDFSDVPSEDIFGRLMAQLAERSKRILLGQEFTPKWLAEALVRNTIAKLPAGTEPNFVDMCCGSGTIVMEVIRQVKVKIETEQSRIGKSKKIELLSQAVTGFDIDPLAVMLSKISWVIAAKDWLEPFGENRVTIPIYHADSLFATNPISTNKDDNTAKVILRLAEYTLEFPAVIISAGWQNVFDSLIDRVYSIAVQDREPGISKSDLQAIINDSLRFAPKELSEDDRGLLTNFLSELIEKIHYLNANGRNGIWAFILRNSYRPGLVAGQFNGLVSNPPWLALSKIADNPYTEALKRMAATMGIRPPGSSFPHLEMATVFLLRSVDRYLKRNAVFGCVVPQSILNGKQHTPFRKENYARTEKPVLLSVDEIWKVDERAFKNLALVLFGKKASPDSRGTIPGGFIDQGGTISKRKYRKVTQGPMVVWTDSEVTGAKELFHPADFEEGADIMPRTLFFHEVARTETRDMVSLRPIRVGESSSAYLVSDAKQCKNFRLSTPCMVPKKYLFDILISKLMSPFVMADPVKAFLPLKREKSGEWLPVTESELSRLGDDGQALRAFRQISRQISILDKLPQADAFARIWDRLNVRNKLGKQSTIQGAGYLVFTGAGGSDICSAFLDLEVIPHDKLLVDQTLYWTKVTTKDEALYLTGLLNSEAANEKIKAFQPMGQQGERHVHELAFGITPPFDPRQQSHMKVVKATKALIDEYSELLIDLQKGDGNFLRWLEPSKSLAKRRSELRKLIRTLSTYPEYTSSCERIYK